MLLRFSVGNYLSFKNIVEFKMAAGKVQRHKNHVAVEGGKKILKGGFIFGANASGKSNLISAMMFAKNSILQGLHIGDCYKKYFRIESSYKNKPGSFQFDIFAGGHFYSYGFAVSYQTAEIEEEWLYLIDDGEVCIFERGKDESGKTKVKSDEKALNEEEMFKVFSKYLDNDEMKRKTFLLDMAIKSIPDDEVYKPFRDVRNWFEKLVIIHPDSKFKAVDELVRDDYERSTLERFLKYFDTGIKALKVEEEDFDKFFHYIHEEDKARLKENILKSSKEAGSKAGRISLDNAHYSIRLMDGDLKVGETLSDHGNLDDLFEHGDESDGTQRLFDLLPIYRAALSGYVIVIDELDRSLHTKATLEFIKLFYMETEGFSCQLIATTHDSHIFDLDLLRQDEIWLVERMEENASTLKSLSSYKPRFDKHVKNDYLIGRYGAVPLFNNLALLVSEDGDEHAQI